MANSHEVQHVNCENTFLSSTDDSMFNLQTTKVEINTVSEGMGVSYLRKVSTPRLFATTAVGKTSGSL